MRLVDCFDVFKGWIHLFSITIFVPFYVVCVLFSRGRVRRLIARLLARLWSTFVFDWCVRFAICSLGGFLKVFFGAAK